MPFPEAEQLRIVSNQEWLGARSYLRFSASFFWSSSSMAIATGAREGLRRDCPERRDDDG